MAGYIPTAAPLSASGSFLFNWSKYQLNIAQRLKQLIEAAFIALQSLVKQAKINAFSKVMLLKQIPSKASRKMGFYLAFFFKSEIIRNCIIS